MFTEEENKIISLFYSGDYELAEQLTIATNNGKLVDKLICKIHRLLYKYKIKNQRIMVQYRDCIYNYLEGDYKNAISLCCCNMLIKGFFYWKTEGRCHGGGNERIEINNYQNELYAFVYDVGYFDKERLEQELKLLGVRLTIGR